MVVPSESCKKLRDLIPPNSSLTLNGNLLGRGSRVASLRPQVILAAIHFITTSGESSNIAQIKGAVWGNGAPLRGEKLNIQKVISDLNKVVKLLDIERDLIISIKSPLSYRLDVELWNQLCTPVATAAPIADSHGKTPEQFIQLLDFANPNCRLSAKSDIVINGPPPMENFDAFLTIAVQRGCRCVVLFTGDSEREMRRAFPGTEGLEWKSIAAKFGVQHLVIFNAHLRVKTECWVYLPAIGRYYLNMLGSEAFQMADGYLQTRN